MTALYLANNEPVTLYTFEGMHIIKEQMVTGDRVCESMFGPAWEGDAEIYGYFTFCYERTFMEKFEQYCNITVDSASEADLREAKRLLEGMTNVFQKWHKSEATGSAHWTLNMGHGFKPAVPAAAHRCQTKPTEDLSL